MWAWFSFLRKSADEIVERNFWRHDSDDKKIADDKYAHASMLFAIVTAKQHKKRTAWVRRWLLICWSCICFKVNWSAYFGVSCKHCWPITARHSRKLGDFLVENRTCSTWTIKSDYFGFRQIRPIFAWQTTDFCWPILLADEIGQLYRSSNISLRPSILRLPL